MRYHELSEAGPSSVQVPNLDGTYKKFKSLNDPDVITWRNSHNPPSKQDIKTQELATKQQQIQKTISKVANIIQSEVAAVYPDSDPYDFIETKLKQFGLPESLWDKYIKLACKQLGTRDLQHYLNNFDKDYKSSQ